MDVEEQRAKRREKILQNQQSRLSHITGLVSGQKSSLNQREHSLKPPVASPSSTTISSTAASTFTAPTPTTSIQSIVESNGWVTPPHPLSSTIPITATSTLKNQLNSTLFESAAPNDAGSTFLASRDTSSWWYALVALVVYVFAVITATSPLATLSVTDIDLDAGAGILGQCLWNGRDACGDVVSGFRMLKVSISSLFFTFSWRCDWLMLFWLVIVTINCFSNALVKQIPPLLPETRWHVVGCVLRLLCIIGCFHLVGRFYAWDESLIRA